MKEVTAEKVDYLIIGGGVIGLAVAYKLSKIFSSIVVLEKNGQVGAEQSSRNSGVIHSGVYYDSGSKKANLCARGNELLYQFAKDYQVPYAQTGKLIVANNQAEISALADLNSRATFNDVPDVRLFDQKEIQQLEKNVRGLAGLFAPTAGILDVSSYIERLRQLAKNQGVIILTNTKVYNVHFDGQEMLFDVSDTLGRNYSVKPQWVINAAGLYADQMATMINAANQWKIGPIRGEYVTFKMRRSELVIEKTLIYPMPKTYIGNDGKQYKSLGIHLTPTFSTDQSGKISLSSMILVGPSVKLVERLDDYEADRYSIAHFTNAISDFFPGLKDEDCEFGYSGITARLLSDKHDFVIEYDAVVPHTIHLIGIDSPGLTSSLAIADEVLKMIIA